ncbi:MAG: hypothetical protein L0Y35_02350 [Flammeovirgaceae bacterium]|nr:hypothetical protein [Flammeovirgaceae bacterium]
MKKAKKAIRLLFLILLLVLAAFGIGITGNFLNNNRERYMDNHIRTEQVDRKDEEENENQSKN